MTLVGPVRAGLPQVSVFLKFKRVVFFFGQSSAGSRHSLVGLVAVWLVVLVSILVVLTSHHALAQSPSSEAVTSTLLLEGKGLDGANLYDVEIADPSGQVQVNRRVAEPRLQVSLPVPAVDRSGFASRRNDP